MAEAIGAASSVITLVITAYQSCKTLYDTLSAIRHAPTHIHHMSCDLEDFYLVLGTIQAILDDKDSAQGILQPMTSDNLVGVLKNSMVVFSDISAIVKSYTTQGNFVDSSRWQRLKWTFKEKDVEDLRKTLLAHKMTLNMAISAANLYNVGTANATADRIEADIVELQEKLPAILEQLEEVRENQLSKAQAHRDTDRAGVSIDYSFALRHYLGDAASVVTSLATPMAPSLQVSSFEASNSGITSTFRTAPTDLASQSGLAVIPERCTQLFIRNFANIKTLVLHVEPENTVEEIKDKIRKQVGLCNARFGLTHAGRVLDDAESLDDYNIAHNSNLTCVSFQPNTADGEPLLMTGEIFANPNLLCCNAGVRSISVKTLFGQQFNFSLSQELKWQDLIAGVRTSVSNELGIEADLVRLIHCGRQWMDGEVITKPQLSSNGHMLMHAVMRLGYFYRDNNLSSSNDSADHKILQTSNPAPPRVWRAPLGIPWFRTRKHFYGGIRA